MPQPHDWLRDGGDATDMEAVRLSQVIKLVVMDLKGFFESRSIVCFPWIKALHGFFNCN